MRESPTVFSPLPPHNGTCGYCGPPGKRSEAKTNYHVAEGVVQVMSCRIYQEMMDRGWRRSGTYYYKPDLRRSCCPQYTIRLDALAFSPSKSQRKIVNKFNRYLIHRDQHEDSSMDGTAGRSNKEKPKGKEKEHVFKLTEDIHAAECIVPHEQIPAHKYEVTLEQSSCTAEKFALYENYQRQIHNDDDVTLNGFTRFLCKSPLAPQAIEYPPGRRTQGLPQFYGSYHQLHRVDGQLIAMSVIDIVPNCVSSVYFMYEKEWEKFSLGKLSAMREAALVKEMHAAGLGDMNFLYMGFYIHSCVKMRYKGEYAPSYVLDPEDCDWFPMDKCRPLLDKSHYASFAHPDRCLTSPATEAEPPKEVPDEVLNRARTVVGVRGNVITVGSLTEADEWKTNGEWSREVILKTLSALGPKAAVEVLLDFSYDISE